MSGKALLALWFNGMKVTQNIFFCVIWKKTSYTGLEKCNDYWILKKKLKNKTFL